MTRSFFLKTISWRLLTLAAALLAFRALLALWLASAVPLNMVRNNLPEGYEIHWSRARLSWFMGVRADLVYLEFPDGSHIEVRGLMANVSWLDVIFHRPALSLLEIQQAFLYRAPDNRPGTGSGSIGGTSDTGSIGDTSDTGTSGIDDIGDLEMPSIKSLKIRSISAEIDGRIFGDFGVEASLNPVASNVRLSQRGSYFDELTSIAGHEIPLLLDMSIIFSSNFSDAVLEYLNIQLMVPEHEIHTGVELAGSLYPDAELQGSWFLRDKPGLHARNHDISGKVALLPRQHDYREEELISGLGYRIVELVKPDLPDAPDESESAWLLRINTDKPVIAAGQQVLDELSAEFSFPDFSVHLDARAGENRYQAAWHHENRELIWQEHSVQVPVFSFEHIDQERYSLDLSAVGFDVFALNVSAEADTEGMLDMKVELEAVEATEKPFSISKGTKAELKVAGGFGDYSIRGSVDLIILPEIHVFGQFDNISDVTIWAYNDVQTATAEVYIATNSLQGRVRSRNMDLREWLAPFRDIPAEWHNMVDLDLNFTVDRDGFRLSPDSRIQGSISNKNADLSTLDAAFPVTAGDLNLDISWHDGAFEHGELRWNNPEIIVPMEDDKMRFSAKTLDGSIKQGLINIHVSAGRGPGMAFGLDINTTAEDELDGRAAIFVIDSADLPLGLPTDTSAEIRLSGSYSAPDVKGKATFPGIGDWRIDGRLPGFRGFEGEITQKSGNVSIAGMISASGMSLDLMVNQLNPFEWLSVFRPELAVWNGSLTGQAKVRDHGGIRWIDGRVEHLEIERNGRALTSRADFGFEIEQNLLPDSDAPAYLAMVGPAYFHIPGGSLEVALIPVDDGMVLNVSGGTKYFEISRWSDIFSPDSLMFASLDISGYLSTEEKPYLMGYLTLGGMEIMLTDKIDQSLIIEDARLKASGQNINLADFRGRIGNSPIKGAGEILWSLNRGDRPEESATGLRTRTSFSLSGEKIRLSSGRLYSGEHNGKLHFRHTPESFDITGEINILSARSHLPAVMTGDSEPLVVSERLNLDIRLKSDEWVRVEHPLFLMELFGQVDIKTSEGRLGLLGRINSRQGWVAFQDRRFDIERASVLFDNLDKVDPTLDILASSRIAGYKVRLNVRDRLSEPQVALSSEPHLEQAQILSLVITGSTDFSMGDSELGAGNMIIGVGELALTGMLQKSLRRSLQLDELSFERLADGGSQFQAGRYLNRNLFLSMARRTGVVPSDRLELDYRLRSNVHLHMSTESLEPAPEIGLKYQWAF